MSITMPVRSTLMAFAAYLCVVGTADAGSCAGGRNFPIFWAGKGNETARDLCPILGIYGSWMIGPNGFDKAMATHNILSAASRMPSKVAFIDLELPISDVYSETSVVERNKKTYLLAIDLVRVLLPDTKIGFYGDAPMRQYWPPYKYVALGILDEYEKWRLANSRMGWLPRKVDIAMPSLYTFYNDIDGWNIYARANIAEALQYGKTTYPVLWPQYHNSNLQLKGTFIDGVYWRSQLDTACRYGVDGIVIWDSTILNPNSSWWLATKSFMQDNDISVLDCPR